MDTYSPAIAASFAGAISDADVAVFQRMRPRLFGIAYRMLGSASDADDVVQDTWMRWQGADRNNVRHAPAFLTTATTRIAINVAQSARARHETCFDSCVREPVDAGADPTQGAERSEALELAARMLLEKLSPPERACFVLREAFDYPYRQIATALAMSEEYARQLVTRARTHLGSERRRPVSADEQRRFLEAFVPAARTGDVAPLAQTFAADVVTHRDNGAVVQESAEEARAMARCLVGVAA
jgi:RNA polymerase sigma factor (sigma-70 family)